MDTAAQLKANLPVAMAMSAFVGISWYICMELNVRLFYTFRRRRGLYFWSCFLASWGTLIHPLATTLTDFGVWKHRDVAMVITYLSWWFMVVPHSLVLYSRLYLVMSNTTHIRWVLYMIFATAIVLSIPTVVVGVLAQTSMAVVLWPAYLKLDKVQLTVFFVQETIISLVYVFETRKRLKGNALIYQDDTNGEVYHHLIWVNIIVIILDCALLGLSCANFFYVQSAAKPAIYAVKLRIEFAILNRLVQSIRRAPQTNNGLRSAPNYSIWPANEEEMLGMAESFSYRSQRSSAQITTGRPQMRRESNFDIIPYEGNQILQTTEISVRPVSQKAYLVEKQ